MPSARIQEMFSEGVVRNRVPSQRQLELEALLPEYAARLSRRGVPVKTLYEEYREIHPDGYRHASSGNDLMRYRMVTHVVGHVEHYAGDRMYIDSAGDKLEAVDSESGESRSVEVFVAILPCSRYTYCEAVWSQSRQDLIKACENALHFYGGVPMAIVPDNLKAAVTRSDRNEPIINEEFAAFAEHYGCSVYPARVRHPKDKALVENAVKRLYRSVYADIEGLVSNSLESLNAAHPEQLRPGAEGARARHRHRNGQQYGYQEIRQILERGDDADFLSKDGIDDEVPVTSTRKNIRGAAYFAKSKHLNKNPYVYNPNRRRRKRIDERSYRNFGWIKAVKPLLTKKTIAMRAQRNEISFRGQKIYVGIDVHLKSWSVTVLSATSVLKKFSRNPDPEALHGFLTRSYPGAEYRSVYEAGFCGFWIHERLTALGIDNIVVNPSDVPTRSSEKLRKTDAVDSCKLARSLRANELKGIYTPDSVSLEMRSLIRLKNSITKDTTRQKNRIKSQLRYLGIEIPQEFLTPFSSWSKRFIAWLKEVETLTPSGRQALDIQIRHLEELRRQRLEMARALRALARTDRFREPLRPVMTVPGFGQATGMTFLSEICDITRFRNAGQLAAYIGMIPMCHSCGEKDGTRRYYRTETRRHAL